MEKKPSYYAVLSADVRYSEKLKPNEKLLYAEITALTEMNGLCFASNSYFAKLYNVSIDTVSRWISNLVNEGFIKRQIEYYENSKRVKKRYLQINIQATDLLVGRPTDQKDKDNTTSSNTTSLIKKKYKKKIKVNIDSWNPNKTSINRINEKYSSYTEKELYDLIDEFKCKAKNRGSPLKDLDAGFQTYLKKGWIKIDNYKITSFNQIKKTVNQKRAKLKHLTLHQLQQL